MYFSMYDNLQMAKSAPIIDPNIDVVPEDLTPPNNLRAWREFRNLKQAQLAELVGTTESVISLLENSKRDLSGKWLARLAPALNTTPGFILDHDPNNLPTDILDVWANILPENKEQALKVLMAFIQPQKLAI